MDCFLCPFAGTIPSRAIIHLHFFLRFPTLLLTLCLFCFSSSLFFFLPFRFQLSFSRATRLYPKANSLPIIQAPLYAFPLCFFIHFSVIPHFGYDYIHCRFVLSLSLSLLLVFFSGYLRNASFRPRAKTIIA